MLFLGDRRTEYTPKPHNYTDDNNQSDEAEYDEEETDEHGVAQQRIRLVVYSGLIRVHSYFIKLNLLNWNSFLFV